MDAYTLHLLGMAVEACAERDQTWIKLVPPSPRFEDGWVITLYRPPRNFPVANQSGPSLADALAALLRDLGVEVPERPSGSAGVDLIATERRRQVEAEGWTRVHDAAHIGGELAQAAACYALPAESRDIAEGTPVGWPWEDWRWRPTPEDRIRELTKAGALIAAEIDRLAVLTLLEEGS